MTDFVNYSQILTDMRDAVIAASLGFETVWKNGDDQIFTYDNMPLCDLRIRRADPELASLPRTYWVTIQVDAEIAAFDMTSRDKCATIRDNLTNALQRFFQVNPRFSGSVDATEVGPAEFEIAESKAQGEFVAATVATFNVKLYSNG